MITIKKNHNPKDVIDKLYSYNTPEGYKTVIEYRVFGKTFLKIIKD